MLARMHGLHIWKCLHMLVSLVGELERMVHPCTMMTYPNRRLLVPQQLQSRHAGYSIHVHCFYMQILVKLWSGAFKYGNVAF